MTLQGTWRMWRDLAWMVAALLSLAAQAQEVDCVLCHNDLGAEKVVHAALGMGCTVCHGGIDASKLPHKLTNGIAKGLTAAQPDLCQICHEKQKFQKKMTHAALGMGCTGCHEPHSSKNKKLLKSTTPELCHTCHDKTAFVGKGAHLPARSGMCVTCHDPHASDQIALLAKAPAELCLECHENIKEAPHVVAGFSRNGHPLGNEKRSQPAEDPLRPGKPFYCGSCHAPHKSDFTKLLRLDPKLPEGYCQKCHQK